VNSPNIKTPIMKSIVPILLILLISLNTFGQTKVNQSDTKRIDRKAVVERHRIIITATNPKSPAQVGNGEFAFGVDITGLQTFIPFNTLSQWSWHSFPLPNGKRTQDFKGLNMETHGRMVNYNIQNKEQPELSQWLAANPHRFNLGRIGLRLSKSNGTIATIEDLKNTHQEVDLWNGIIYSSFELEGKLVSVKTACHPTLDAIGVSIKSDLIKKGQVKLFVDFPYPDLRQMADYVGVYNLPKSHSSVIVSKNDRSAMIDRKMDDTNYFVALNWSSKANFLSGDTISSPHRFYLDPQQTDQMDFTCTFSAKKIKQLDLLAETVFTESTKGWNNFWKSGAAIDLSQSKDKRWKELERRIVLSQYLMKLNESGSYPPQESGLVNNGWYGRYHFEMIWWHGVHYALWNRWPLFDRSLHVYRDFLPTSKERATNQGYTGARWPKCTATTDVDWPHPIHALLIWQQPHPIYFAELDFRLHTTKATLEKWRDIVFESANFMADFAFYEKQNDRYILGPPIYIVSENTKPETTYNPSFEIGYWRFGLRTAQIWNERLGLNRDPKWEDVLKKLCPLPKVDGIYITHENIENMWTKFTFEHPGLTGTFGMLPGDGVDTVSFRKTLNKVMETWNFDRTWGWDFPMVAMAAARTGNPELAIDMLLHSAKGFQFDEHGLATGGPFPYFPSNGALLTAVAMMAGGWDGSKGDAPGFPKDGNWTIIHENFNRMP